MEVTHYLFPEFSKGVVLMKNGIKNETTLNYNSLTEEMLFETKGVKLALGQLDQIDTVFVNGRKFIPIEGKFLELVYHSKYSLIVEHKCSIKDPGKPAGYGGTSQTSATTSYSSYLSGGQVYDLKLPEGIETKPYVFYWLGKDGKMTKFLNVRQLIRLFGDKESVCKEYVKKNNVDYEDQNSILNLIKYMEIN